MNSLIPVDFFDVSQMAAALVLKHAVHFSDTQYDFVNEYGIGDVRTIVLRGPANPVQWYADEPQEDAGLLAEWPGARNLIAKMKEAHVARAGREAVIGRILVRSLAPGAYTPWHAETSAYAVAHDRFHVCLVPSSGAILYAGGVGMSLPVGQLTFLNAGHIHSEINFGPCPRMHMIIDVRRPDHIQ